MGTQHPAPRRNRLVEFFFPYVKEMRQEAEYFNDKYRSATGSALIVEPGPDGAKHITDNEVKYNLKSFDGGKSWYACKSHEDGTVKILGLADEVHPNLLESIGFFDDLTSEIFDRVKRRRAARPWWQKLLS